jgi:hypothetical protein
MEIFIPLDLSTLSFIPLPGYIRSRQPHPLLVVPKALEIPIDSGMGLSVTIDKLRVFINKTLSLESESYQQTIDKEDWLIN